MNETTQPRTLVTLLETALGLSEAMNQALEEADASKITELRAASVSQRPALSEALDALEVQAQTSPQARELQRLAAPMLLKLRGVDQRYSAWCSDLKLIRMMGVQLASQVIMNAPDSSQMPPFDVLRGAFEGLPAVIVAAGPSLDKNFHLLPSIADRALIVTMNRCVRLFEGTGVTPHLTLVLDGKEGVAAHHFKGVDPKVVENLMCRPSLHPNMAAVPRKRTFLFTDVSAREAGLMQLLGKTTLPMPAGTVAHACVQTAYHLGCDPIIVIGQDLAYTGGQIYSKADVDSDQRVIVDGGAEAVFKGGRTFDGMADREGVSSSFKLQQIPGWDGEPVPSSADFIGWIADFELLLRTTLTKRRFINATEGGAHIEGMVPMRFEEAIRAHIGPEKHDVFARIEALHDSYVPPRTRAEIEREVEALIQALVKLKRVAGEAKRLASSKVKNSKAVGRLKKKSAQLRGLLEQVGFLTEEITYALTSEAPPPTDSWQCLQVNFAALEGAATKLLSHYEAARV